MSVIESRTRHSWQHEPQEQPAAPPPLEPGDRLTRAEFERRAVLPVIYTTNVQEYLVWQIQEQQFDWFYLTEGQYIRLPATDA